MKNFIIAFSIVAIVALSFYGAQHTVVGPVRIIVLDTFGWKDKHGREVAKIAEEASFGAVEVKRWSLGDDAIKYTNYVSALLSILQEKMEKPDEKVVVNISLGSEKEELLESFLISKLIELGVIVVAAAGNDGVEKLAYPARYEGVVSVGTVGFGNRRRSYSNYGDGLIFSANCRDKQVMTASDPNSYTIAVRGGTSFSAPEVSGTLAYIWACHPQLSSFEVVDMAKNFSREVQGKYSGKMGKIIQPLRLFWFNDQNFRKTIVIQIFFWVATIILILWTAVKVEKLEKGNFYGVIVFCFFSLLASVFFYVVGVRSYQVFVGGSFVSAFVLITHLFICENFYSSAELDIYLRKTKRDILMGLKELSS